MAEESGRSQIPRSRDSAYDRAKWIISPILMLVVTVGYWAVSRDHRTKLEEARATAEQQRQIVKPVPKTAADMAALPSMSQSPHALAAVAALDGVYAGPICYGPAPSDRPRCFRAQATIVRGKIAGQWPGREPGVTMVLAGEVSAAGEARIRVQAERPDGTRTAAIDLLGTFKDGRLDAVGSFHNGRTAMLNWRRTAIGSR